MASAVERAAPRPPALASRIMTQAITTAVRLVPTYGGFVMTLTGTPGLGGIQPAAATAAVATCFALTTHDPH